ncbi:polygalacturonase-like isoform X2 [Malus sylvestris]|uniref:polygalacturonase-like isoform X3 n=1 Tax=Malus domestica TaxID=3750 RepID=UPI0010AA68FA|nr:polygalacturonase-like isoform X3 [Malus domestica]XP_050116526.1 polygalacturonase-like isoform X2 [Malus sylvestris]
MALQKNELILFFIITLPSFVLCYSSLHENQLIDKYVDEASEFDSKAYPSYFNTIDDGSNLFKGLIKESADVLCLKSFDKVDSSTSSSAETVSVNDFGAEGDGETDDTKAFEMAWKVACSSKEAVMVAPKKTYRIKPIRFSGPCKSQLTVQILGTLIASDDRSDFSKDGRHWLIFDSVSNLVVEGGGAINGNGKNWWQNSCKTDKSKPCKDAPTTLTFYKSKNLMVRNLTIQDGQQIHVSFQKCMNVEVSNLSITAPPKSPNTDGIHVTDTQNILITSCVIATGDDCLSIVNGSKTVQASNITCGSGHVNGAKLYGTTNGIRIKTWQGGSGSASNIRFQNIEMHNVTNPILIDQYYCDRKIPCKEQRSAVEVKNVVYKNIKGTSASDVAIKFDCSKSFPCLGIILQDINLQHEGRKTAKALCNNVNVTSIGVVCPLCPKLEGQYEICQCL